MDRFTECGDKRISVLVISPRVCTETMSKRQAVCRFCLKQQEGKHVTALFTLHSLKTKVPEMLSSIFAVPVIADDGLSAYVCRYCIASARSLNEKLLKLRAMAETSYRDAHITTGNT